MEQLANSAAELVPSTEELFDKGELHFGRVLGVNKTKRGRTVLLQLIENDSEECVFSDQVFRILLIKFKFFRKS